MNSRTSFVWLVLVLALLMSVRAQAIEFWKIERHFSSPTGPVVNIVTLPNGQFASTSLVTDESIKIWDAELKNLVRSINRKDDHGQQTCRIAVLANGDILSCFVKTAGATKTYSLRIWNTHDGSLVDTLVLDHADIITDTLVLPDNTIATASQDGTVKLWDPLTHANKGTFRGHTDSVLSIGLTSNDWLITGSKDHTVKVFNLANGQRQSDLNMGSSVYKVLELPNGQVAVGCQDGQIKLLDRINDGLEFSATNLTYHNSTVLDLAVTTDGLLVSSSTDNTMRVWDLENGMSQILGADEQDSHLLMTIGLVSLPDNLVASASLDWTIKVWDAVNGNLVRSTSSLGFSFQNLVTLQNGNLAGTRDSTIYIWNPVTATLVREYDAEALVTCLIVLRDGSGELVSGDANGYLKKWDLAEKDAVQTYKAHGDVITKLVALSDGKFASASRDKLIKIWRPSLAPFKSLKVYHTLAVNTLAVLPNDELISGGDDKLIIVYDSNHERSKYFDLEYPLKDIVALNNSKVAITYKAPNAVAKTIEVYSLKSGRREQVLQSHQGDVTTLAVLDNGYLASGSLDRTIKIWNAQENELITTLDGHSDDIYSIAVRPYSYLMSSSLNEVVEWKLNLDVACQFVEGHITAQILRCHFKLDYQTQVIDLSGANIKSIDVNSFNNYRKVTRLLLNDNQIEFLAADTFAALTTLTEINLNNNYLSQVNADLLRNQGKLKTLGLAANRLTSIPMGFFKSLSALTVLYIQSNSLFDLDVDMFQNMCLNKLELTNNVAINQFVEIKQNGTCLEVSDNRRNIKLTQSYLSTNGFSTSALILEITDRNIQTIDLAAFNSYRNVEILDLSLNVIDTLLPGQFDRVAALNELILSNNRLASLPDRLFTNAYGLAIIKLDANVLTSINALTFSGLEESLEKIDLRNNKISKIDGDSFKSFTKLRRVYLRGNPIVGQLGVEAVQSLCTLPCMVLA